MFVQYPTPPPQPNLPTTTPFFTVPIPQFHLKIQILTWKYRRKYSSPGPSLSLSKILSTNCRKTLSIYEFQRDKK